MKLALLSDIHDNVWNLEKILTPLQETPIDALLYAGDLCAPFILGFLNRLNVPVHIVFGNNDGDRFTMQKLASTKFANIHLHGEFAEIEVLEQRLVPKTKGKWQQENSFKIAMNHYPAIAYPIAVSGLYDLVVYGHNHTAKKEKIGNTYFINPGTIMGFNPGAKEAQFIRASYVVLDTGKPEEAEIEWV